MSENHTVQPGECVSSLAFDRGLNWETVWNHPSNAALKASREDANILKNGDTLFLPDRVLKEIPCATDSLYVFIRKGASAKLRIRILDEAIKQPPAEDAPPAGDEDDPRHFVGEDPVIPSSKDQTQPRANVPYVLKIDGKLIDGTTDSDGMIECPIPPNARNGTLTLEPGTLNETVIPLQLGILNPLSEVSGAKHRLANLGFDCGDTTDSVTPDFGAALSAYQETFDLDVTGELDQATRDRLFNHHGS